MLDPIWIILIVVASFSMIAMFAIGWRNPIHGGGKSLNKLKKNFGLIGLFLILTGGLMLA